MACPPLETFILKEIGAILQVGAEKGQHLFPEAPLLSVSGAGSKLETGQELSLGSGVRDKGSLLLNSSRGSDEQWLILKVHS